LRSVAIGAAIGAGTGFLIGQIITRERHDDWQTIAYFCTIVGLGGGTALGSAFPAHPTVYRSSTPLAPAK
jgi:Na+-driven multidrug efflux pump